MQFGFDWAFTATGVNHSRPAQSRHSREVQHRHAAVTNVFRRVDLRTAQMAKVTLHLPNMVIKRGQVHLVTKKMFMDILNDSMN